MNPLELQVLAIISGAAEAGQGPALPEGLSASVRPGGGSVLPAKGDAFRNSTDWPALRILSVSL